MRKTVRETMAAAPVGAAVSPGPHTPMPAGKQGPSAPGTALAAALRAVAVRDIRAAQQSMEQLINATPTGADRNILCDMNIELMQMHNALIGKRSL